MAYLVNRVDVLLMQTLDSNEAYSETFGLTINEIMELLADIGYRKCRMTVYRHLTDLCEINYISKGVRENHADTYYLLNAGKNYITNKKGE